MAELFVEVAPDGFFDGATLYGHSLGACVAFAVTRLLEEAGARPRALVLAAAPAPKTRVVPWLTDLDDRALLQALIDMGQFPREAPELFDLFRHAIRADLEAAERYQPPEEKLKTPALLLAATDDGLYRTSQIEAWRDHLEHSTFRTVAGGHLFVTARPVDVAGELVGFTEPA
jgi:pyochelin biosynthetic protein PchC